MMKLARRASAYRSPCFVPSSPAPPSSSAALHHRPLTSLSPSLTAATTTTTPPLTRSSFLSPPPRSSFLPPSFSSSATLPRSRSALHTTATTATAMSDVLQFPRAGHVSLEDGPSSLDAYAGDLLVLAVWAHDTDENGSAADEAADEKKEKKVFELPAPVKAFDKHGFIAELVADAEFSGKAGSTTEVGRMPSGSGAKRVVVYGLGSRAGAAADAAGSGAGRFAVKKGKRAEPGPVGLYVEGLGSDTTVRSVAEGATVGAYVDERYKHADKRGEQLGKVPGVVQVVGYEGGLDAAEVAHGVGIGMGIITTKEVVNSPANELTPASLAACAEAVAKETGLACKVMGGKECEEMGMGLYMGVGRGSTDEPKFIHMTYTPEGGAAKTKVAIVGKAVTFDTGGSNLKAGPGSMIELMKFDMGGAGATLGTAKALGVLKPKGVEVHFIMPAVENMLSDRAIHPGDILTAMNGTTVEVLNTDAEGRLCLADALVYAQDKVGGLDYVVDIATLTGAIIVSLGNDVAGVWATTDELAGQLKEASEKGGENLWRMPLVEEYVEGIKSRIADLRNISAGRAGGSITAALFLREFVEQKKVKHWAHMDIAGTVWADKKDGATGYGVKTLVNWVEGLDK